VQICVVSVKITKPLSDLIQRYLEIDAHVTKSDFIRDAIREKIKRDVPELYEELFKVNEASEDEEC